MGAIAGGTVAVGAVAVGAIAVGAMDRYLYLCSYLASLVCTYFLTEFLKMTGVLALSCI